MGAGAGHCLFHDTLLRTGLSLSHTVLALLISIQETGNKTSTLRVKKESSVTFRADDPRYLNKCSYTSKLRLVLKFRSFLKMKILNISVVNKK